MHKAHDFDGYDPDRELVALAKKGGAGGEEAFGSLVARHSTRIQRICLGILRNKEDAEDAAQEAFMKAFNGLPKFQESAKFSTWLTRIAANQALMDRRKKVRVARHEVGEEDLSTEVNNAHNTLPAERPDARSLEKEIILRDTVAHIKFGKIPARQMQSFMLQHEGDLSGEEIAGATKQSIGAVKSQILRARLALQEQLKSVAITATPTLHGVSTHHAA